MATSYGDVATLKQRLSISADDTADDAILTALLEAASRSVDADCGRTEHGFYETADATRYFDGDGTDTIMLPDLISMSAITVTDEDVTAWVENTDYRFLPYNSSPKYALKRESGVFASDVRNVSITGHWGYAAVPTLVAECTYQRACRMWRRKSGDLLTSERIGPYAYTRSTTDQERTFDQNLVAPYKRVIV
jgi:hypothetical protein